MSNSIQKRDSSPLENCGFILHFLALPVLVLYVLWVIVPDVTLQEWDIAYYPPKEWSIYIPTSIVCTLVSILFLNAAMNASIAPKPDCIDTMWDEHSKPKGDGLHIPTISDDGGMPEICDIDVSLINDMVQKSMVKGKLD